MALLAALTTLTQAPLSTGATRPSGVSQNGAVLAGTRLIAALRAGGYVIVMRHAESPRERPTASQADAGNVRDERQLDTYGRVSARAMGVALRSLRIPIGTVLASPTYRTLQTVQLAGLGPPVTVTELGEPGPHHFRARRRDVRWLRHAVALAPTPGTDTLVVTHSSNMLAAFGAAAMNLPGGKALVFHPDGRGATVLVAHVPIEEWPRLAAAATP
jgi:broad specificity phosphatase PhoE